jgi:hypothetical protein
VREWLDHRGLTEAVLRLNHVGADPGRTLARTRGLPRGDGIAAVFPALDREGEVTYVQTRYLHPDNGRKYDNPASHLATNPRLAWPTPVGDTATGLLVVCEGIPDALTAAQHGHRSVALLGAQSLDDRTVATIADVATETRRRLVAVPDHDPAGHAWATRLHNALVERGIDLQVTVPPEPGMDLNTWFTQIATTPLSPDSPRQLPLPGPGST